MSKENILPVIITDLINNATDKTKSPTMRQFYIKTLTDIRTAIDAALVKIDKEPRK